MKVLPIAAALLLPLAALAEQPAPQPQGLPHPATESAPCTPSMGLNFVCGLDQPEDLLQIGASKWIVASGMGDKGGIFLIDSQAKTAKRFFTGAVKADRKTYPDCASAPASFNSHGLALRPAAVAGTYTLYSVTHLPFESIQVFAVDERGAEPAISWTGCVKLPADFKTNSVTAAKDGTILWRTRVADYKKGYSITGAPLIVEPSEPPTETWYHSSPSLSMPSTSFSISKRIVPAIA